MFMRSERLFLRPGWPEDWEEVLARIADETALRAVPEAAADARLPQFLITLPTLVEPARIIGCIALTRQDDDVVLNYWIAREHWGQGYASEAGRAILQLARVLGHRRIIAHPLADNPAAARVLRKLGFCPTGRVDSRGQAAEYATLLGEPCDCDDDPAMKRAA